MNMARYHNDLIINKVELNRNTLHTDDGAVRTFPAYLSISYTVILNEHEADGHITIREGDQDTHDSLDKLTLDDLRVRVADRLGVRIKPTFEWDSTTV
jgi:hypothetical protein